MIQPKISVIVPVYNAEEYLPRCINSIRNQTLQEIEIILVDDASEDSSPEICDREAEEDCRIKVIHKENEGAGMARNSALEIATGEYIGFVDSDDYVKPEMFQTLYDKAKKYGSDLVLSGVIFVDGNMFSQKGENTQKNYFCEDTQFETVEELKKLRMGIVGSLPDDADDSKYGMSIWKNLFRTEVIKKNHILFQSERVIFSEDAMFMLDYISCIKKATGIAEAFYHYCRNGESVSKSYQKDRFEKGLAFVCAVERKFQKDIDIGEYQLYLNRFWQAFCRVVCTQEIIYAMDHGVSYPDLTERLKMVCNHKRTVDALRRYPIRKLSIRQGLFAYCMKQKWYFLLKLLVGLRR